MSRARAASPACRAVTPTAPTSSARATAADGVADGGRRGVLRSTWARRMVWSIDSAQVRGRRVGVDLDQAVVRRRDEDRGPIAVQHRTGAGDERGGLAGGDPGKQSALGVLVGAREQGLRGDQRGQQGGRRQRAADLLEHDQGLEEGEPGAVVLLGDAEGGGADLLAQRLPERLVVPGVGLGWPSGRRRSPRACQQRPHGRGELLLLLGERELHQPTSPSRTRARWWAGVPQAVTRARTLVIQMLRSNSWV